MRSRNTSLNAQHTIEFQVGTGYIKRRIIGNVIYPFGFGKYQFDFFPNSRTKLSGFVTGYYSYEDYSLNNDAIVTPALSKLSVHSGLSTSYFINFRTRIQANFSILSFINNIENVNGRNHFSFDFTNNISFLHSIF
ncbi:MAG: hypothetical protein IPL23_28865 [Saprospiraceae bacterium]|nr:hypothetical protein [Saprospiraceae bacterium]